MTTNETLVEEQLANIIKSLEEMSALLQNQEMIIDDLVKKVVNVRNGETSRTPRKQPQTQEDKVDKELPTHGETSRAYLLLLMK